MIKCGECGYENMDGLDYCDGCGAKLRGRRCSGAPAAAAPEAAPPQPLLKVATRARRLRPRGRTAADCRNVPKSEAPTGGDQAGRPRRERAVG